MTPTTARRPRLLDLFSGAGGAARGYQLAGFEVTGIDHKPQPRYAGDHFYQADVMEVGLEALLRELGPFEAVHASPPCQAFSAYRRRSAVAAREYTNLIAPVREQLQRSGLAYVIENVPGAPLLEPIQLCGSSFGLDVRRHRYFECSIALLPPPCDHGWQTARFPPATNRTNLRRTVEVGAWRTAALAPAAMGIEWMETAELSQAIPPAYAEWIGRELIAHLERLS